VIGTLIAAEYHDVVYAAGGLANVASVREQEPLPKTADELSQLNQLYQAGKYARQHHGIRQDETSVFRFARVFDTHRSGRSNHSGGLS
jgi:hypothetical protein